jgi:hypothetical protein
MNRYLVIAPHCAYFVTAHDIESAVLLASIWSSVRVIKWMPQP